jgi:hypothetical protein
MSCPVLFLEGLIYGLMRIDGCEVHPRASSLFEEYRRLWSVTRWVTLGYDHTKCPGQGPVPVMVQQTLGIGACAPNTKVTEIDLHSK